MESNHVLLAIALVAIVAVVGITQYTSALSINAAVSARPADASSNCIQGLQVAAGKLGCGSGDFQVVGYAFYLKESGDISGAREYCKNAPTAGCQGLCTAAVDCLETLG